MNIVKTIEQYNHNCVYYCDPIKNNIMNEGIFIRILYSNELFILNGISLYIHLTNVTIEKYFNKYKCSFDTTVYKDLIHRLKNIEADLLDNVHILGKQPQYKICEQLQKGYIKIFLNQNDKINANNNRFVLKISGIWETELYYGVTYKFLLVNHL